MSKHTLLLLGITLIALIAIACFFSAAETSMMALNRYRLRHLAKQNKAAARAIKLLNKPDRLLGVVLIGNTCANIIASAIMTLIISHFFDEWGVAIATGIFTLFILIFAEVMPKTIAAIYPEKLALPATIPLIVIDKIMWPLVWLVNKLVNGFLKIFNIDFSQQQSEHLSLEELRTLIYEAGNKIPENHQKMLLQILELEKLTVADIMVPRQRLTGIDITASNQEIAEQLLHSPYRRLPVYQEDWHHPLGFIRVRDVAPLLHDDDWSKEQLLSKLTPIYVVPETTRLHTQLINFRRRKTRSAFVVDEFGEILGLVTLEDLLEEIVGEFTTDFTEVSPDIQPQADGSYLVDGGISLREINRYFHWHLPLDGPKTLSGLLIEHLQLIPTTGVCLRIDNHPFEIMQVANNRIKMVRIRKLITVAENGNP